MLASLEYEHIYNGMYKNQSLLEYERVSRGIIFIQNGEVRVSYKGQKQAILLLKKYSYFGEISYIFKLKNLYKYMIQSKEENTLLYSIKDSNIEMIMK